jgi:phage-related protein
MTKTLGSNVLTQAAADNQAPVTLVEVDDWGGADISWAACDKTVTAGGRDYAARDLSVSPIKVDMTGRGEQAVTVTVDNRDFGVSDLIDAANPKGNKFTATAPATVAIKQVFLDDLTAIWIMAENLQVQSYRISEGAVEFYCRGVASVLDLRVPRRTYSRTCWKEFGSAVCGAAGTACSVSGSLPNEYTYEACVGRSNVDNFGGFTTILERLSG